VVVVTVIDQRHEFLGQLAAVGDHPLHRQTAAAVADGDVVKGFAVTVVNFQRGPAGGKARGKAEPVHVQVQAEERFRDEAVHPTGRAGVPGPAATANVGYDGVDVGRHHVRLDAITGDRVGGVAVGHGVDQP